MESNCDEEPLPAPHARAGKDPFMQRSSLANLESRFAAEVRVHLDMYEDLCARYLAGKSDDDQFLETFGAMVANMVTQQALRKYFETETLRYPSMIKVAAEWKLLRKPRAGEARMPRAVGARPRIPSGLAGAGNRASESKRVPAPRRPICG